MSERGKIALIALWWVSMVILTIWVVTTIRDAANTQQNAIICSEMIYYPNGKVCQINTNEFPETVFRSL